MLESEIKDQNLLKLLRTCKVCGEILLGHINNFLDVAKINANKIEINESLTKTTGLVERIWTLANVGLEKKGLIGHLAVDMKMPLWLSVDAERLHQILDNLLGNAIKFTTTGSVRISFKWLQEGSEVCSSGALESARGEQERINKSVHLGSMMDIDEEKESFVFTKLSTNMKSMKNLRDFLSFSNGQSVLESLERTLHKGPWEQEAILKIEIIDTGCGITEDAQKKLFMPFVQADRSITRQYGGTGLGLYIAKMLVEKMGGTLKLSSMKDIGTRFEIVLPMKPVKEIDKNQQQVTVYNRNNSSRLESRHNLSEGLLTLEEDLVRENAGKRESKKVLVVDDDISNQFVLDSFLKKLGYEGDMANNGREAVEMFRKKTSSYYLFIAMDIQMPGMDGITAAKEIRKFEAARKMKKIPIVFVTGNCSEDEQMECLTSDKIGCSYFFRKPFRYNDCKACIERIKSSSKIL